MLGGPAVLVTRLERWVALAWIGGLATLALIFGVVARSAAEANLGDTSIEEAVGRLGGNAGGAAAWIGYEFLYLAALVAFAAAGQVSALRNEEADGHLDNLLARAVSRRRWLAGRLGFAVALVALAGLACGIGGWIGVATPAQRHRAHHDAPGGPEPHGAGRCSSSAWARSSTGSSRGSRCRCSTAWCSGRSSSRSSDRASRPTTGCSTPPRSPISVPVPATSLDWSAIAWLAGLGVIAALAGLAAFDRRDLAAA